MSFNPYLKTTKTKLQNKKNTKHLLCFNTYKQDTQGSINTANVNFYYHMQLLQSTSSLNNTFFQMEPFLESLFNLHQGLPILTSFMAYVIILGWMVHSLFDSICAMPWCNRLRDKCVCSLEEEKIRWVYTVVCASSPKK